ncbi:MAG: gliding motility-associated C-terminal domain-containing protein, partial [Bacteroidota bacterium]
DTTTGAIGPWSFLWTNANGDTVQNTLASANNIDTVLGVPAGTYSVVIVDSAGQLAFGSISISDPDTISALMSATDVLCNGGASGVAFAEDTSGTGMNFTFTWTDNNGNNVATNTGMNTLDSVTGLAAGTYDVLIDGCRISTGSITIGEPTVLAPNVGVIQPTSCFGNNFCDGSATTLVTGGTPPYSYAWPNGGSASFNNTLCSGPHVVTVTDNNGCSDTVIVNVPEPSPLQITAFGDTTICISNSTNMSAQGSGGTPPYLFTWNKGAGVGNPVTVSPVVTTIYTVTMTDANNCPTVTDQVFVNVRDPLKAFVSGLDTICPGDTANIQASGSGGDNNYFYTWSNGMTGASIFVTPNVTTLYTVTVSDGCGTPVETASTTIQVGGYPPIQVSITPETDTICRGEGLLLQAAAGGGFGNPANFRYTWNQGLPNSDVHFVFPNATTTYTVTVTDNCLSTEGVATATIALGDFAQFDFDAEPATGCRPVEADFTVKGFDPNSTYSWNLGDGNKITTITDTFSHTYTGRGCFDVRLTVTTPLGCQSSIIKPCLIETFPNPIADFSFDPPFPNLNSPSVTFFDESSGAINWHWEFSDGFSTTGDQFLVHLFNDTGNFAVTLGVENIYGCTDSVTKFVPVDFETTVFIPAAFSPNGDGVNDVFGPIGNGLSSDNFSMFIFDRWGTEVYSTSDPNSPWNGRKQNSGNFMDTGVYAYFIRYQELSKVILEKRGTVTLVQTPPRR